MSAIPNNNDLPKQDAIENTSAEHLEQMMDELVQQAQELDLGYWRCSTEGCENETIYTER